MWKISHFVGKSSRSFLNVQIFRFFVFFFIVRRGLKLGGVAGRGANRFPHFHGSSGQRLADHLPGPTSRQGGGVWGLLEGQGGYFPAFICSKIGGKKKEFLFVCIRRCGNVWMDSIKSGDEETWRSRLVHSSTTNKKCGWTWFNVHSSARRGRIKWKGGDENR